VMLISRCSSICFLFIASINRFLHFGRRLSSGPPESTFVFLNLDHLSRVTALTAAFFHVRIGEARIFQVAFGRLISESAFHALDYRP
jgi:hypothetical protein